MIWCFVVYCVQLPVSWIFCLPWLFQSFRLPQSIPVTDFQYWSCKSWVSVLVLVLKLLSLGLETAGSCLGLETAESWSWNCWVLVLSWSWNCWVLVLVLKLLSLGLGLGTAESWMQVWYYYVKNNRIRCVIWYTATFEYKQAWQLFSPHDNPFYDALISKLYFSQHILRAQTYNIIPNVIFLS